MGAKCVCLSATVSVSCLTHAPINSNQWFVEMEAIFVPDLILQDSAGNKILQKDRLIGFQKSVVDHASIINGVLGQLNDTQANVIRSRYENLARLAGERVGKMFVLFLRSRTCKQTRQHSHSHPYQLLLFLMHTLTD